MKPYRFAYIRPYTVDEAVAALRDGGGGARVLAGGQSLLALMNQRLLRPSMLVDLASIPDLRHVTLADGVLRVGAMTTQATVAAGVGAQTWSGFGLLPESMGLVGHAPIRARGTVGGSIAHADPRAEWCLLAVLLEADVLLQGPAGVRSVAAGQFFTGTHRTAAGGDEVVVEIRFPRPAPAAALAEFAIQQGNFPLVAAGVAFDLDADGVVVSASVALGGVADRPVRAPSAEAALLGGRADEALFAHAGQAMARDLDPPGDIHADPRYRTELAGAMFRRALRMAISRHPVAGNHGYDNVEAS